MSITLTLTQEELDELERLLNETADHVLVEIRHTDNRDFRKLLEHRYQVQTQTIDRIREAKHVNV